MGQLGYLDWATPDGLFLGSAVSGNSDDGPCAVNVSRSQALRQAHMRERLSCYCAWVVSTPFSLQRVARVLWNQLNKETREHHITCVELFYRLHCLAPTANICEDIICHALLDPDKVSLASVSSVLCPASY